MQLFTTKINDIQSQIEALQAERNRLQDLENATAGALSNLKAVVANLDQDSEASTTLKNTIMDLFPCVDSIENKQDFVHEFVSEVDAQNFIKLCKLGDVICEGYELEGTTVTVINHREDRDMFLGEAIGNLEIIKDNVEAHIMIDHKVVHRPQGWGSALSDYKLSRYGCYMIALCCDHRKSEVAMAKKYFAIQTRKAELIEQQEQESRKLKISDEEALKMAMECLEVSGVEQPVISQFKMRQLAKLDPDHKELYESVCGYLASTYVLENKPILVTKVGQMICVGVACACTYRLGLNRNMISFAKVVNKKLVEVGLQEPDIKYKEGKPYNKGYVLSDGSTP
jgi:hypothetical protein